MWRQDRLGVPVIDEHDAVAHKHLVLYHHPRRNEAVTLDFHALADHDSSLNLNTGPDLGVVPDFATVQIHEIIDLDIPAEFNVRRNTLKSSFSNRYSPFRNE